MSRRSETGTLALVRVAQLRDTLKHETIAQRFELESDRPGPRLTLRVEGGPRGVILGQLGTGERRGVFSLAET